MAEENTERNPDESEEVQPADAPEDVSAADASADAPAAEESEATEDQTPEATPDEDKVENVPEPANEPLIGDEVPNVQETRVSAADGSEITAPITDISMLLDIPVTLSMEIGQTKISINELLKLGKDSVIELQRMAHEPLDVLVNGTLVAHGEAVVVGDRFGIRLTDVISPQERLRKFG